ncbi:uncharacterized protein [Eurosta solidaginis]|uniref:uncharacterized protein n=1 Tax=Eurosta solidaginis TaxID=178769 RepID=UPI003530582F
MFKRQSFIAPLSILFFLTSSCLVAGQVRRSGSCRTDKKYVSRTESAFQFQSSWYVHSRYTFRHDENYRCCKIDYTRGSDNVHTVTNFRISNKDESVEFNTGKLTSFPDEPFQVVYYGPREHSFKYNILTYCDEYFITYFCENVASKTHREYLWVHTKDPKPPKSVIEAYKADLVGQKISTSELKLVSHEDCGKYETNQKSVAQQQSNSKGKSVC